MLALAIVLAVLITGLTTATAAGATLGEWKRALVRANRASETPVRVHRSLNYRASWGFAARATAWRVSGTVFGMKRTARLTPALKKRLRPHLPRRISSSPPRLSAKQVRRAQAGVPRAAARWAPTVERYWSRWLWRHGRKRLTVAQLNRALWVIWYESRGDPDLRAGRYYGLFQVDRAHSSLDLRNPVTNASLAGQLFARRGWRPWAATAYRR